MKTKKYAEETDGLNIENMQTVDVEYVTEAQEEAIQYAGERMLEAVLQSGMRYIKTLRDEEEGVERLFLDAEDASASVVANLVSDLKDSEFDYTFSGTMQSMDTVAITTEFEPVESDAEKEEVEVESE
jgi:hypothetical protein